MRVARSIATLLVAVFSGGVGAGCGGGGGGVGPTSGEAGTDSGSQTVLGDGGRVTADASGPGSVKVNVDLHQTSVSGLSSGAFFAVQFHVAFSSIMKGAAIFAGGPFFCAQGSESTAVTTCESSGPNAASLVTVTKQYFSSGYIDDPTNLAAQKVFLFGGADDMTVAPVVMDSLSSYYGSFMSTGAIDYVSRRPATAHTLPTLTYGGNCDETAPPYVGDCSYDGAGAALAQIYGPLAPKATTLSGSLVPFAQSKFVASPASHSLADTGYAYVPSSCAAGEACRIHVSFHGCEQNEALVGTAYYQHGGFNEWADTNHIIVLYPQTVASYTSPSNPSACWDWWGYDGANYAQKTGSQMAAMRAMIDWVIGGGLASPGGGDAGAATSTDAGTTVPTPMCFTASNTAQVAAGRATALAGYAYATGTDEFLGADTAAVMSSVEEIAPGYYGLCP